MSLADAFNWDTDNGGKATTYRNVPIVETSNGTYRVAGHEVRTMEAAVRTVNNRLPKGREV